MGAIFDGVELATFLTLLILKPLLLKRRQCSILQHLLKTSPLVTRADPLAGKSQQLQSCSVSLTRTFLPVPSSPFLRLIHLSSLKCHHYQIQPPRRHSWSRAA